MTNDPDRRDPHPLDGVRLADIRAATMLRESGSISFEAAVETALVEVAAELRVGRSDVIRLALREWLAMRQREPDCSATQNNLDETGQLLVD